MLYALRSTIYTPLSMFYQLVALCSTIYHLPSKPIYALLSMFYQLPALRSMISIYPLSPSTLYSLGSTIYLACEQAPG